MNGYDATCDRCDHVNCICGQPPSEPTMPQDEKRQAAKLARAHALQAFEEAEVKYTDAAKEAERARSYFDNAKHALTLRDRELDVARRHLEQLLGAKS